MSRLRSSWSWVGHYPIFVYTRWSAHNIFDVRIVKGVKGDQNAAGYGPKAPAWMEYQQTGLASKDAVVAEAFEIARKKLARKGRKHG